MTTQKIIIVGAAASGKDWFRRKLEDKGFKYGLVTTTRPPRESELHGKDYWFITKETFLSDSYSHKFIETSHFPEVDWYYGTYKTTWDTSNVFVMNPASLKQLPEFQRKKALVIWLNTPLKIRIERLNIRKDINDKNIRRVLADEKDFHNFFDWDIKLSSVDDFNFSKLPKITSFDEETVGQNVYRMFQESNFQ